MGSVFPAVLATTGVVASLAVLVLIARRLLIPSGTAVVTINGSQTIAARFGDKLLETLARAGVILPAACGGRGACGQCRVTVVSGGGQALPNEVAQLPRANRNSGDRLACRVTVDGDLSIQVPNSVLNVADHFFTVQLSRHLTPMLKELTLIPEDASALQFQAGDYVLVQAPPGTTDFAEFTLPESARQIWERNDLMKLRVRRDDIQRRAYSIASGPAELPRLQLVVRIALPPPGTPRATPPGQVSSYLFGLKFGDRLQVQGPFGNFHATQSEREMVLIGGGAGIAPLRSIARDQLLAKNTSRRISLWYGARRSSEVCYRDEFDTLQAQYSNFHWHPALSDPGPGESSQDYCGLIHQVVYEQYLKTHPNPEQAEFFLCGPPLMSSAVTMMLEDLGVNPGDIYFDDFGA